MRITFPSSFRTGSFLAVVRSPFQFVFFIYLLTLSGDLLHATIGPFNFKLNNLISIIFAFLFSLIFKTLRISSDFFWVSVYLCCSMLLSAFLGYNLLVCLGFVCFFIFSYLFYFVFPSSLFFYFNSDQIFRVYSWSFVTVGIYATLQVFCSLLHVTLPFVGQSLMGIARGQGFSYEPSYYALYMTPFAIFKTTQFLLTEKKDRKIKDVVIPNFFLLVSTSTGCFFSYLFYLFFLFFFRSIPILRNIRFGVLVFRFILIGACFVLLVWFVQPAFISRLFFKFFFYGLKGHGSFLDRWQGIERDWKIFLDHFWTGTGLGGTTAYILLSLGQGADGLYDREQLSGFVGTNVTTEVLAGLGVVGAIGFIWLCILIFQHMRKAIYLNGLSQEERVCVVSLSISLLVLFLTLQFSQTIFRPYLWVHVAICIGYAKHLIIKNPLFPPNTE